MVRGLACIALIAAMAILGGSAHATWPRPAAGDSASGDPEVIFTFDDGPHETRTVPILDELRRRNIKAIFFWVGYRVAKNGKHRDLRRRLVERAVADGHIIGNHTINHVHLCSISRELAAREIDVNARIFEKLTGQPQLLFRAPYGNHCPRLVSMLHERHLGHVFWDIDPREWEHKDAKRTASAVIRKLKKLRGRAVILLHDTKPASVRALPRILDWIEEENARRVKDGRRPIRILDGSDLMAERIGPELTNWANATARDARDAVATAISRLVPGYRLRAITRR